MNLIAIASDHAGFELKSKIAHYLNLRGLQVRDFGGYSSESVDYPDVVHPLCRGLRELPDSFGILICGSGNGVCMTANKYSHIRAALCWTPELAALARQHNDANVLCIPARFVSESTAMEMVAAFLESNFEGGRHEVRVSKIVTID